MGFRLSKKKVHKNGEQFLGKLFIKINLTYDKLNVLQTTGVIKFIHFNNQIPRIPPEQIFWLNTLLKSKAKFNYETQYIKGTEVKVLAGPFKGMKGNVVRQNSVYRVTLWIDIIMQGISVEIDPANFTMVEINNNHPTNNHQIQLSNRI